MVAPYVISKLGAALSGGVYLKMKYPIFQSTSFVRVYKDGVLQVFGVGWDFNPVASAGSKLGIVADLTDGIRILGVVAAGSTYRLEYDERTLGTVAAVEMWRNDGASISRRGILLRLSDGSVLTAIAQVDPFKFTATYGVPTATFQFADRLGTALVPRGASIPTALGTGWRLEVYRYGRRTPNKNDGMGGIDKLLVPIIATATNVVTLTAVPFFNATGNKLRSNRYRIRLRNTLTNAVTPFSPETVYLRKIGIRSATFAANIGRYNKSGIL